MGRSKSSFGEVLLEWHRSVERHLPWKSDIDPYKIWLSEVILQQTRVAQGIPYFLKFSEKYSTIVDLANADEDEILKLWQGLGYYSRARNLHQAAKTVRDKFYGRFPDSYEDVLSLKGVGEYTAAAICSFAYGLSYPVVDGNVIRVVARFFGVTDGVDLTPTLKRIKKYSAELIKGHDPGMYNQAIMDFGSLHCTPQNPKCSDCPFASDCKAKANGLVGEIPKKVKKIKKRNRYFCYLIFKDQQGRVVLNKRLKKDVWQSLYDFPSFEFSKNKKFEKGELELMIKEYYKFDVLEVCRVGEMYKHVLSHQTIYANFYKVDVRHVTADAPLVLVSEESFREYPVPVLISNFVEKEGLM